MLLQHAGKSPTVDPTAYVAPNAVVCGDVTIGPRCRIPVATSGNQTLKIQKAAIPRGLTV